VIIKVKRHDEKCLSFTVKFQTIESKIITSLAESEGKDFTEFLHNLIRQKINQKFDFTKLKDIS